MANRIRGYCALAADIVHGGHINFIQECANQCDLLVVGLMSDLCIEEYKGRPPIMPFYERELVVWGIKGVDMVVRQSIFSFDYIRTWLRPDIIFDSSEHVRLHTDKIIPYFDCISSTEIKQRIIDEAHNSKCKAKRGVKRK